MTEEELGVQTALARQGRRQREARNAEICRLAGEGLSRQAIADRLGITYHAVLLALKKSGVSVSDARHERRGATGAVR